MRALAVREGKRVALPSRTGLRLDATYPEGAAALGEQACADFTVGGEFAFSRGRSDFARLAPQGCR